LLIVIALVVVLIGVGAALVLPTLNTPRPSGTPTQAVVRVTDESGTQVNVLPTNTPEPVVELVVAVQPIGRGTIITEDLVGIRVWPEIYAPINGISDLGAVIGRIARVEIVREQPILSTMITENLDQLGATGSDAGALLPIGTRMIAVPIDRFTSVAYAIQPGDRVDVVLSLLYVDLDEDFQTILPNTQRIIGENEGVLTFSQEIPYGRRETFSFSSLVGTITLPVLVSPSEERRPRLTTQITVQDALVVYTGNFPPDGRILRIGATPVPPPSADATPTPAAGAPRGATPLPPTEIVRPSIVSLAVSPQEAVVLTYLLESQTPVTFLLRPARETGRVSTEPVTLDYIMNTYNIQVPARRPFGVQPAIRTIRRLVLTDTIAFSAQRDLSGTPVPDGDQ
jgi:pilus assembly protein CpaB